MKKLSSSALLVSGLLTCAAPHVLANAQASLQPEQLYPPQSPVQPSLSVNGEWAVGVQTVKVVNPSQLDTATFTSMKDRNLTLEVWYPTSKKSVAGKAKASYEDETRTGVAFSIQGDAFRNVAHVDGKEFPLVVLSHGYTGYRTIMFYLAEHLASHGYVVASVDHSDSTNKDVDFKNAPFSGFMSTLYNRSRDQQFVLEHFSKGQSKLAKSMDTDNASVIGYSMGGYGAVNTIGGCYNFSAPLFMNFGFPEDAAKKVVPVFNSCQAGQEKVDPRWKGMIAYAPWGQELNIHQPEKITVPSMYIAGEEDDVSGFEHGVKKLYEQTGAKDKYLVTYANARHNFAPHPAPRAAYSNEHDYGHYAEPSWDNVALNNINKHLTLAFLNCHIKQTGCDMLPTTEKATQKKIGQDKFTEGWPGFPDRWAAGVSFYRGSKMK